MKCYITENRLTLVGKAWEVRAKLREWMKKAGNPDAPLTNLMQRPKRDEPSRSSTKVISIEQARNLGNRM